MKSNERCNMRPVHNMLQVELAPSPQSIATMWREIKVWLASYICTLRHFTRLCCLEVFSIFKTDSCVRSCNQDVWHIYLRYSSFMKTLRKKDCPKNRRNINVILYALLICSFQNSASLQCLYSIVIKIQHGQLHHSGCKNIWQSDWEKCR